MNKIRRWMKIPVKNLIPRDPWETMVIFLVLVFANAGLAYGSFSLQIKSWIFFAGIVFPIFLWIFANRFQAEKIKMDCSGISKRFLSPTKLHLAFWPIFFLSVILRAHFYLSSTRWPGGDEALNGFLAIDLAKKWKWDFFYTCGQLPPLLTWGLSFLFKLSGSYRLDLWFVPLLVSSLTVFAAYWAFRPLLKDDLSLVFGCLMAFSFWPVYQEGFCHQGILVPLWETSLFLVFGFYLRHSEKEKNQRLALILGLTTGMGSFTFTSWPVVAFGIFLAFFFAPAGPLRAGFRQKLFFLMGFILAVVPFCWAVVKNGYGAHILGASSLTQWYGSAHQWVTRIDYLSTIFWGPLQSGTSYGPVWGGMLNPLLGSLFLIGIVEVLRHKKTSLWLVLGFFLALLPGFLSADYVEMFRIVQVMPLVLFIATIGCQPLFRTIQGKKRAVILGFLLCVSFGLDFHHLSSAFSLFETGKRGQVLKTSPNENLNAFRILEKTNRQRGPGLIFTDFLPLSYGHLLGVTTYSFNALTNPRLIYSSANWAGILTNVNYQPFLSREFPQAEWYWAGTDLGSVDGGLVVGIIPLNKGNQALFGHWAQVHQFFHQLSVESENDFYNKTLYHQSLQKLGSGYPLVEKDRFLESCYGEWVAQYFFNPSYSENIAALQRAIQQGYPAAHLYQKISELFAEQGRMGDAQRSHELALKAKPDFGIGPNGKIESRGAAISREPAL